MNRFVGLLMAATLVAMPLSAHALTLKKGETIGSDGKVKLHCKENPVGVIKDNGVIAKKLAARRTINVFRAWDTPQSGPDAVYSQSYG